MVHFLISSFFQYPRISELSEAAVQSAIWLFPSAICGGRVNCTFGKKDNILGVIALSLTIGLLISEVISLFY